MKDVSNFEIWKAGAFAPTPEDLAANREITCDICPAVTYCYDSRQGALSALTCAEIIIKWAADTQPYIP